MIKRTNQQPTKKKIPFRFFERNSKRRVCWINQRTEKRMELNWIPRWNEVRALSERVKSKNSLEHETNVKRRRHRVVISNVRIAAAKKRAVDQRTWKADFNLQPKSTRGERNVCTDAVIARKWKRIDGWRQRRVDYTRRTVRFCLQSAK